MTENEEFIYESIFNQIRMGFHSIEDIKESVIEEIEDNRFEEEISNEWAFETIEKEHNKLVAESKKWEQPTDTDRLFEAFDELCKNNIIALHNAGFTTSDGEYEVVEVERSLRENNIISDGYCFYHEQDLAGAICTKNPSLTIAFQKVDNSNDEVTLEVGKKVVNVLKEKGFEIEWDENPKVKIVILNFKWQWLYNENNRNLLDYDHVIKLMT